MCQLKHVLTSCGVHLRTCVAVVSSISVYVTSLALLPPIVHRVLTENVLAYTYLLHSVSDVKPIPTDAVRYEVVTWQCSCKDVREVGGAHTTYEQRLNHVFVAMARNHESTLQETVTRPTRAIEIERRTHVSCQSALLEVTNGPKCGSQAMQQYLACTRVQWPIIA